MTVRFLRKLTQASTKPAPSNSESAATYKYGAGKPVAVTLINPGIHREILTECGYRARDAGWANFFTSPAGATDERRDHWREVLREYCIGAGTAINPLPSPVQDFFDDDKAAMDSDWKVAITDFNAIVEAVIMARLLMGSHHSEETKEPGAERETGRNSERAGRSARQETV